MENEPVMTTLSNRAQHIRPMLPTLLALLLLLLSVPLKVAAAQQMAWEVDIVPVMTRGWAFLDGGAFPAYGTLSSVAAYNMPFLVWLHLPAMLLTREPKLVVLLTLIPFHLLGGLALYGAGREMVSAGAGLGALALYSFSEVVVSGSYTPWAQLLLPSFFAMVLWLLWRWTSRQQGIWLMDAGVVAFCAFMTHFAAVMLFPVMLLFALVMRARWQWRWLLAGIALCGLLIAPYLAFQSGRGFSDLRAFLSRDRQVDAVTFARYEPLKPGSNAAVETAFEVPIPQRRSDVAAAPNVPNVPQAPNAANGSPTETGDTVSSPGSQTTGRQPLSSNTDQRLRFVLGFISEVPEFYTIALTQGLGEPGRYVLQMIGFLAAVGFSLWGWAQVRFQWGYLRLLPGGRMLVVALMVLACSTLLIGINATPKLQPTYYLGMFSWQMLLVAYGWLRLCALATRFIVRLTGQKVLTAWIGFGLFALVCGAMVTTSTVSRLQRLGADDPSAMTPLNRWRYDNVQAAVDLIAAAVTTDTPRISYDLLDDNRNLWWLPAWHSIDPLYRVGMAYDALLAEQYGIRNASATAIGLAPDADIIVTYRSNLARYNTDVYRTDVYRVGYAGPIAVLVAKSHTYE